MVPEIVLMVQMNLYPVRLHQLWHTGINYQRYGPIVNISVCMPFKVKCFLRWHFRIHTNPPAETDKKYVCSNDSLGSRDMGIGTRCMICTDNVDYFDGIFPIEFWCIYSYSWSPTTGIVYSQCANGYHLSSCENMHCVDTFKCLQSYCIEWKYVCDNMCDCPLCEDENICKNVSCPGMILHESVYGKVYCNEQADERLAAVLIQSSSYDLYTHAQSEMCAQVLNCYGTNSTSNSIVYLDLLYGSHLDDQSHVTWKWWNSSSTVIFHISI